MKKILVSWSSGKDCAWMLHQLHNSPDVKVVGLLTVMNEESRRVAMHDVREKILEAQALNCGLPLWKAMLPNPCSHEQYEEAMRGIVNRMKEEQIDAVAFGDLFLEWIRNYRISRMEGTGVTPIFPLWGQCTHALSRKMIAGGLRAKIVSVDTSKLDPSFIGREYDLSFLEEIPASVDPCGENGEFHTCVYAGPMFASSISLSPASRVERQNFVYMDFDQR